MGRAASRASLFLVSLFGLSFELFLNRYLTLTLYSDYAYWVISVALLGYSFGGVLLVIFRDWFDRNHALLQLVIPPLLIGATVVSFLLVRSNPFNPLQLQNAVLWRAQVVNILLFYAALFPVFLLTGTFIGLMFLTQSAEMPKVYAMDLLGAAGGAVIAVVALFFVHPIHLPAVMLPVLLAATVVGALAGPSAGSRPVPRAATAGLLVASVVLLGVGLWVVLSERTLTAPDYKQLHAVLGIKTARVALSRVSPAGTWIAMDDYTEYADTAMTNNYGAVGAGSPPRTLGLFRDGARVAALPLKLPGDDSYLKGSLSSLPYILRPRPAVLLLGTDGGMRIIEASRLGVREGVALEQPGDLYGIVRDRLRELAPGFENTWKIRLQRGSIFGLPGGGYDVIDVGNDFLGQDSNNSWSFTREAVERCLAALSKGGIFSLPMDISEVDVYALKMANTIVAALQDRGIRDPSRHIIAYRTAWTARLLVSPDPFSASDISRLVSWCNDRSFDTSWYPGIKPAEVAVWNDLPPVTFEQGSVQVSDLPQDALRDDLVAVLSGAGAPESRYFSLAPSTMDRPEFYSVSRLSRARSLLNRLEILPEKEIGYLLNLAILAEALVLALIVAFLPLVRGRSTLARGSGAAVPFLRVLLYFSALGLGFFFIELTLVKKLSFLLESATLSFAVVVAAVLVFSGLGSWHVSRFGARRRRALLGALPVIGCSLAFYLFGLDPLMRAIVTAPLGLRVAAAVILIAPVSFALGRPFALGTSALAGRSDAMVPWAWAINGAFSVLATPLANIISVSSGWDVVVVAGLVLYASTAITFPERSRSLRGS